MKSDLPLIDALRNAKEFPWSHALFLPKEHWTQKTRAMILDPDNVEDPDNPEDLPLAAKEASYDYILMLQDLESIYLNAKSQKPDQEVSDDELFMAFMYYFNNDAFITL